MENHLVFEDDIPLLHFPLKNGDSSFKTRSLKFNSESTLKAADEPWLKLLDFMGRPITSQHELGPGIQKSTEGMEKLVLSSLFSREKLDIIDEHDIGRAVGLSKGIKIPLSDRIDKFIGKLLRRQENHFSFWLTDKQLLGNGRHQVSFAEARTTVDEKWIKAAPFT